MQKKKQAIPVNEILLGGGAEIHVEFKTSDGIALSPFGYVPV